MTMRRAVHVDKAAGLLSRLRDLLEAQAREAVAQRGRFSIALTGGSLATLFFPALAQARCDWEKALFFWGDERAVPPEHAESNYGVARTLWLSPAGVPDANVHRMPAEGSDLEAAARAYTRTLTRTLGGAAELDLVLLGVGPDGHVCSLFPGHPVLGEERSLVAAVFDAPKPPPQRLTLTLPVLARARSLVVVALGTPKAGVVRDALQGALSPLPLARVLRDARRPVILLDPDAASLLDA